MGVDVADLYQAFTSFLEPGASVLDAGCGSGRDVKYFREQGFQMRAFDASEEMARLATRYSGVEVQCHRFLDMNYEREFDGLWSCASLLHVAPHDWPDVLQKCVQALKPGGVWYLSFKYGEGTRVKEGRSRSRGRTKCKVILAELGNISSAPWNSAVASANLPCWYSLRPPSKRS